MSKLEHALKLISSTPEREEKIAPAIQRPRQRFAQKLQPYVLGGAILAYAAPAEAQWITQNNPTWGQQNFYDGSPSIYPDTGLNRTAVFQNNNDLYCSTTNDGGNTWSPEQLVGISTGVYGATICAGNAECPTPKLVYSIGHFQGTKVFTADFNLATCQTSNETQIGQDMFLPNDYPYSHQATGTIYLMQGSTVRYTSPNSFNPQVVTLPMGFNTVNAVAVWSGCSYGNSGDCIMISSEDCPPGMLGNFDLCVAEFDVNTHSVVGNFQELTTAFPGTNMSILDNNDQATPFVGAEQLCLSDDWQIACYDAVICGDGNMEGVEQCDDGVNNGVLCNAPYNGSCNYCTTNCTIDTVQGSLCGDMVCDSGDGEDSMNCASDCMSGAGGAGGSGGGPGGAGGSETGGGGAGGGMMEECGNGIQEAGEQCDNGVNNTDQECIAPVGEQCTYCDTNCESHTVQGTCEVVNVNGEGNQIVSCDNDAKTAQVHVLTAGTVVMGDKTTTVEAVHSSDGCTFAFSKPGAVYLTDGSCDFTEDEPESTDDKYATGHKGSVLGAVGSKARYFVPLEFNDDPANPVLVAMTAVEADHYLYDANNCPAKSASDLQKMCKPVATGIKEAKKMNEIPQGTTLYKNVSTGDVSPDPQELLPKVADPVPGEPKGCGACEIGAPEDVQGQFHGEILTLIAAAAAMAKRKNTKKQ